MFNNLYNNVCIAYLTLQDQYPGIPLCNISLQLPSSWWFNIYWFIFPKQTFPGVYSCRKWIPDLLTCSLGEGCRMLISTFQIASIANLGEWLWAFGVHQFQPQQVTGRSTQNKEATRNRALWVRSGGGNNSASEAFRTKPVRPLRKLHQPMRICQFPRVQKFSREC